MATSTTAKKRAAAEGNGADNRSTGGSFSITNIHLDKLFPSPTNPRKTFSMPELVELAASIKLNGLINPITVRESKGLQGSFEVVSGGRRYRASVIAEMREIPCIVRDLSDDQVLDIQIEENLHRQDVPPLEEAAAFQDLLQSKRLSVDELAGRLNKSTSYVYRRLKLNTLDELYRPHVESGVLPTATAEVIASYPEAVQKSLFKKTHYVDGDRVTFLDSHSLKDKFRWEACTDLKKAIWPLDRGELQPGLVACNVCPKNTAVATLLFPDGAAEPKCTDKGCWKIKESVWKALCLKEWEAYNADLNRPARYADLHYYEMNDKKDVVKILDYEPVVIGKYDYEVVEQGTPGAFEVLFLGAETWYEAERDMNYTRGWVIESKRKTSAGGGDYEMNRIEAMDIPEEQKQALRDELTEKRRLAKILAEQRQFEQTFRVDIIKAFLENKAGLNNQVLLKIIRLSVRHEFTGHNARRVWLDYFGEEAKTWMPESFAVKVNGAGMKGEENPKWTKGVEKAWSQVLAREKRKGEFERMDEQAWGDWISHDERAEFMDSILLHCDDLRIMDIFADIQLAAIAESITGWNREPLSVRFFTELAAAAGINTDDIRSKVKVDPEETEDYEDEEEDFDNDFEVEEEE